MSSKKGKKNKRGERGSTEEDTRAGKKANMAASGMDTGIEEAIQMLSEESQEEPSLLEIKNILIDIQIQLSTILKENIELRNEFEELKCSATDANKELKNTISSMNNRLKTMYQDLENQREETERLSEELDNLEQYSRKNSVEIHGIPQDAYTNTEQVVIKLAEALNITVEPEDIEISHKINKGKAIIAKFVNHKAKARLYKERTKLKGVRLHDLFPGYPSSGNRRIYLNENLTPYRRELVEEANKRKHDGTLVSVWTLDGKVYVKTSPDFVELTEIIPAVRTDHDAISLELGKLENELKGPGNWKMNCSLLDDEEYEEDMARMIPLWTAEGQKEFTDNRMIWDWVKYNIRAHAIQYSKRKAKERVTRASVINEYEEGGLRMVDLECMVKSLRLAWLKRIFSGTNGTWKSYLQHIMGSVGGLFFFNCNYNISDYTIPSQFYRELLLWWSQFRETFATEEDWKTIIWNNKEIKVEHKPVYYKHYVNARVICIQDLLLSLNSTDSYN
ncbi:unnamed protein product, partial [Porites lobata]